MDRILRATSKNQEVRAFVAETRELVETISSMHKTSPVASAALGRTLTAAAMMGITLKGDNDQITVNIKGDGPIGGIMVAVDGHGHVRGYVSDPLVNIPCKTNGKLDVAGAIGRGSMTIMRDMGLKEPYVGQINLVSGEIAEDFTYYFASSEQTNSVVALGVLVDTDYSIKQAGGFMIQLMPGASEETISLLEKNITGLPSVTNMMEAGKTGEDILNIVLAGLEPKVLETTTPTFKCNCSHDRYKRALLTIGVEDITEMIDAGERIETTCHFCNSQYYFDVDELIAIREEMLKK